MPPSTATAKPPPRQHQPTRAANRRTNLAARDLASSTRSPLRYPGGKSRAVSTIRGYIPSGIDTIVSPFLGGGSVELACAAAGLRVHGADAFHPVIDFWHAATRDSHALAARVATYHPLSRARFYHLQKTYDQLDDPVDRAAVFFVLNRSSFSGTTLSGGMSPAHPRFTPSAIARLHAFHAPKLSVECAQWQATLDQYPNEFMYLDPPYANGGRLYGKRGDMHDGFDHAALAATLRRRSGWILSYNDCAEIRQLYRGCQLITPQWTYGMNNSKRSKELLILDC